MTEFSNIEIYKLQVIFNFREKRLSQIVKLESLVLQQKSCMTSQMYKGVKVIIWFDFLKIFGMEVLFGMFGMKQTLRNLGNNGGCLA